MIGVLDWMEFQVLAAARGVEAVYSFSEDRGIFRDGLSSGDSHSFDGSSSPGDGRERKAAARYAVYQMVRDKILAEDGDGLKILPPFSCYMEIICASPRLVVIDRGGYELPRQCIYHVPGASVCKAVGPDIPACEDAGQCTYVCLEESPVDEQKVCLSGMDWDRLCRQMEDLGQLPPPRLKEGIGAYDYEAYWRGHMPGLLWERLEAGCEVETDVLLEEPLVHTAFSLRDTRTGELKERMLLLDSPLEYCLLRQYPGGAARPRSYSRETALEILKTWWRDGT